MLLVTVFAAGLGASYALADDGHGNKNDGHGTCTRVHVRGTIAPQTLTVTLSSDPHLFREPNAVTATSPRTH